MHIEFPLVSPGIPVIVDGTLLYFYLFLFLTRANSTGCSYLVEARTRDMHTHWYEKVNILLTCTSKQIFISDNRCGYFMYGSLKCGLFMLFILYLSYKYVIIGLEWKILLSKIQFNLKYSCNAFRTTFRYYGK